MDNLKTYESFWKELLSKVRKKRDIEEIRSIIGESLVDLYDKGFGIGIFKSNVNELTVCIRSERVKRGQDYRLGGLIKGDYFTISEIKDTLEFAISYLKDNKIKLISMRFNSEPSDSFRSKYKSKRFADKYLTKYTKISQLENDNNSYFEGRLIFSY